MNDQELILSNQHLETDHILNQNTDLVYVAYFLVYNCNSIYYR